jgi:hypothetical protein
VLEVTVNDRRYGLADAVDARHQRPPRDEADQQPRDHQHADGAREADPEALLERRKQAVIAADQQTVGPEHRHMHQGRLHAAVSQIELDPVIAGRRRHHVRPRLEVSGQAVPRPVGEQQGPIAGDLHADAGVDEVLQAFGTVAPVDIAETLRIGLQDLRAALLNGALPGVPQRSGEQHQGQQSQDHVSEGERQGRGADHDSRSLATRRR